MRISCCVPYCRRTVAQEKLRAGDNEWICQIHWSLVPKDQRRAYGRARRRKDLPFRNTVQGRLWARIKRTAIERGVGI